MFFLKCIDKTILKMKKNLKKAWWVWKWGRYKVQIYQFSPTHISPKNEPILKFVSNLNRDKWSLHNGIITFDQGQKVIKLCYYKNARI